MLKAGPGILGGVGMISSIVINNHFRTKLKLGQYGRMSSYLSVVAIPAMFSALFHTTVCIILCLSISLLWRASKYLIMYLTF